MKTFKHIYKLMYTLQFTIEVFYEYKFTNWLADQKQTIIACAFFDFFKTTILSKIVSRWFFNMAPRIIKL